MGRWIGLAAWLAVTFLAAAIGGTSGPGPWYAELEKPAWTPPSWVFGPVWTTLYILMAVAAWMVWERRAERPAPVRRALTVYVVQLALNALWSLLFFRWQLFGLAALEILVLLAAIVLTMRLFAPIRRPAAWLLAPYLVWVSYATTLSVGIWWMNR